MLTSRVVGQESETFSCFALSSMSAVNKKPLRLNDLAASGMLGTVQEILRLVLDGWKYAAYIYIYTNWRIVTLPWDSVWTWWVAFIVADFLYYWTHRASHEINFIWASHQVHHSSEDYTFSSALRQSVLLNQILWVPALSSSGIDSPASGVFSSFSTKLSVSILDTYRGRNRYCIDKNYAGVLIIWDRMFGTFEAEKEKEEIAYGLINTSNTFEPLYIQFGYTLNVLKKFWSTENWRDKLSVLFKGPGWSPGKPWHGNAEDIPVVEYPIQKYDPPLPLWRHLYAIVHVASVVIAYATLHRIQHAVCFNTGIDALSCLHRSGLLLLSLYPYESMSCSPDIAFSPCRPYACSGNDSMCISSIWIDMDDELDEQLVNHAAFQKRRNNQEKTIMKLSTAYS
ncbi:alkylglycerol monooxygenase [Caerostris darwini]|uniref:Alkylglycerol monooxygenase n=1 Tax=Caerostris darwini TaxID=1538125 RepID=A0AAV4WBJ9_9ARAC|nr:alkylglycerol monooxygenase [Caerostris darwini]